MECVAPTIGGRGEKGPGTCWLKKREVPVFSFLPSVYLTMPWRWISIDFESSLENLEETRNVDGMYSTDKFASRSRRAERLQKRTLGNNRLRSTRRKRRERERNDGFSPWLAIDSCRGRLQAAKARERRTDWVRQVFVPLEKWSIFEKKEKYFSSGNHVLDCKEALLSLLQFFLLPM